MFTFPFTNFAVNLFTNNLSSQFDGINERIDLTDDVSLRITNNLSFFAWIKTTSASNICVASKYNTSVNNRGWVCYLSSGRLHVTVSTDGTRANSREYETTTTFNDGTWHHIGFTYASGVLKLYVDAVEQPYNIIYDVGVSINPANGDPVRIGSYNTTNYQFFGYIDELAIWDTAVLSQSQIDYIYNDGTPTSMTPVGANLVSHYRMGDGDNATTLFDNKGSNDGTLVNMNASNYVADVP